MTNRSKQLWQKLTLSDQEQELESRIFNAVAIITIIYLKSMVIFNYVLSQYLLSALLFITSIIILGFYLAGRSRKNYQWGIKVLAALSYPILALNFYLNDGIQGPTPYIFLMVHIIVLTLSERKTFWFWTIYNIVFFITLYFIHNFYPDLIANNYSSPEIKFLDQSLSYMACAIGMMAIISALKWNYQKQKIKNELKSVALTKANLNLHQNNEQKNKIIALISHDLKNPLLSITKILEMIKEGELSDEETKSIQEDLFIMASNTQKMAESILDWATVELKNTEPNYKRVNIKKKSEEVLNIYHNLAKQKGITLNTVFLGSIIITTDIDRLLLIIRNLLQNAIKFTPTEGKIDFSFNHKEHEIIIEVSDTGVGIPEHKLNSIFDMDFQSTEGTQTEKGTGFGLFICNENAKKIKGELNVQSEVGKGTTFTLSLPVFPTLPAA
ncbi:sensor histidine kinase KdpD [Echinicola sp. 20G]|uniref:sensor histidine kinase n=1 Tax=Echinicola sp. 20G TaxID=2781961 RepID=UPI001F455DB7|nr:HAMP domain-containing sensor histidine kinase [Echinicola sp. 20G]